MLHPHTSRPHFLLHPLISYSFLPSNAPHTFSLLDNGIQVASLEGDWADRLYQLTQGDGQELNCYQGANYVLTGSADFDGPLQNETQVQGTDLSYADAISTLIPPIGIQWITKNITERNPEESLEHLHSAILLTTGSEESAIVFEIPGYHYAPRFAPLAEVHAREMEKANAYQTVRRHFYETPQH